MGNRPTQVLLVEDNPADAKLISELINETGFNGTISWICDGAEALKFVRSRFNENRGMTPDVILLDLNLPKLDGREFLRELKSDPVHCSIPVIIITGSDRSEDVLKSKQLRAESYQTKPSSLAEFCSMIERLLQVEFPRLGVGSRA